ncbi:Hsp70 protein-domain-containing protein, partial [Mycena sanguinolenta]
DNLLGKFKLSGILPTPPFDFDTNDILNVFASDKTTSKSNCIIITNDKGHLSKEEIDCMAEEAEKSRVEDEATASRIAAKNGLEPYSYNLQNSLTDEKLANKFDPADTMICCALRTILAEYPQFKRFLPMSRATSTSSPPSPISRQGGPRPHHRQQGRPHVC